MNELSRSSKYRASPQEPVSSEEREQLTRRLNDAFSEGKLTQDDYSAKLDELYAARQLGDLVPVVEALPAVQAYNDPAIVQQQSGQPGELSTARNGRQLTMVLGGGIAVIVILIVILLVVLL